MRQRLLLLLICIVVSACSSLVSIDYDKETDFQALKTFTVKEKSETASTDTRINSQLMQQRVVKALKQNFIQKQYTFVEKNADMQVKYHLQVKTEVEFQDPRFSIGIGSFSRHSSVGLGFNVPASETSNTDKLVLTIDVYSSKTNKLIWRGSFDRVLLQGSTPETYNNLVKKLIEEILKAFPPTKKK